MNSLLDYVVEDFEARDTSHDRIVTRSARRLLDRGCTVSSITYLGENAEGFRWGQTSTGRRVTRKWKLEVLFYKGDRLVHTGALEIRETSEHLYVASSHDRKNVPEAKRHVIFAPDGQKTEKLLRGDKIGLQRTGNVTSVLVLDRCASP